MLEALGEASAGGREKKPILILFRGGSPPLEGTLGSLRSQSAPPLRVTSFAENKKAPLA